MSDGPRKDPKPDEPDEPGQKANKEPIFYRGVIRPEDVHKKSRFCRHGNPWGRCPHGC